LISPDPAASRARIKARLAELRGLSRASADGRAAVKLDQTSVGRLSRMDAMQQQAMAGAEEARRRTEIMRLEHALKLIDADEYGWCAACGERIPDKRMEIDPAATLCVKCASGKG
jgi:DnaK suppressor protein